MPAEHDLDSDAGVALAVAELDGRARQVFPVDERARARGRAQLRLARVGGAQARRPRWRWPSVSDSFWGRRR